MSSFTELLPSKTPETASGDVALLGERLSSIHKALGLIFSTLGKGSLTIGMWATPEVVPKGWGGGDGTKSQVPYQ